MVLESVCVEIGTALGVDAYAIDTCLYNNQHDITSAGYNILRKWVIMQENRVIAWNELVAALRQCELNSWVIDILKKNIYWCPFIKQVCTCFTDPFVQSMTFYFKTVM